MCNFHLLSINYTQSENISILFLFYSWGLGLIAQENKNQVSHNNTIFEESLIYLVRKWKFYIFEGGKNKGREKSGRKRSTIRLQPWENCQAQPIPKLILSGVRLGLVNQDAPLTDMNRKWATVQLLLIQGLHHKCLTLAKVFF